MISLPSTATPAETAVESVGMSVFEIRGKNRRILPSVSRFSETSAPMQPAVWWRAALQDQGKSAWSRRVDTEWLATRPSDFVVAQTRQYRPCDPRRKEIWKKTSSIKRGSRLALGRAAWPLLTMGSAGACLWRSEVSPGYHRSRASRNVSLLVLSEPMRRETPKTGRKSFSQGVCPTTCRTSSWRTGRRRCSA